MRKIIAYGTMWLCLLQISLTGCLYGQETAMKHYTVNDGLPSNTVFRMLHDSKGFIWICTDAGVSRYDGVRFTNFNLSDGLAENEMISANEDSQGRIWLLGFTGTLTYYYKGKFFSSSNDSMLKRTSVRFSYDDFFEDRENRLWFTSLSGYTVIDKNTVRMIGPEECIYGGGIVMNYGRKATGILTPMGSDKKSSYYGLFVYSGQKFKRYIPKYQKSARAKFCHVNDGSTLFISDAGIVRQKDMDQKLLLPFGEYLTRGDVNGVFLSSDNELWVSTKANGTFRYNYADLSNPPKRYLQNRYISYIVEDGEHNIWFGTENNGIYMLPRGYKRVSNYYYKRFKTRNVYAVAKDKYGNIYTGHDEATVLILNNGKTSALSFKKQNSLDKINRLLVNEDDIWIGTDIGLTHVNPKKGINTIVKGYYPTGGKDSPLTVVPIPNIKDISLYKNNVLTCNGFTLYKRGPVNSDTLLFISKGKERIYCAHADKKGLIWFGYLDGLYSSDGGVSISHTSEDPNLRCRINDIDETEDSVLLLATYGHGLIFYKNGRIIYHLTVDSGLSSNVCRRLFVNKDQIFVATAKGATRITFRKGRIIALKKFTTADYLLSNNVNDVCGDDSTIYFATSEGLSVLNTTLPELPAASPPLDITSITCKGRKLDPDSSYTFNHDQNAIQFNFIGINYRLPGEVIYQYRFKDGQNWIETKNTTVDIPYLAAGSYHFQLQAKLFDGPWSRIKSFRFSVNPPFWQTYWFIIICLLLFMGVIVSFSAYILKMRRRKDMEKLKIKDQIATLEQQALQAMMNPHFIFNVMNSIQHFINNNERHEANLHLADFARLIRMNLDISSKKLISLDEEVAYLELYMQLEIVRFDKKISYEIIIDPDIDRDETMLPAMLLQPFIENAIWHGLLPKGSGNVQVQIVKEKETMLKIQITDNGVGMPDITEKVPAGVKTHISKGMKLTRQRLELLSTMSGHAHGLSIQNAFPGETYKGTKIEFSIPADLN